MKKFLAMLLALTMALALVACGGNNSAGTSGNDAGGAGTDDDVTLHFPYTSLTSMAFLGQARTQAGPSSRWTQKSHLIIRFRSGEMAGTP